MDRFYGNVGFANTQETAPGVYSECITKRPYMGDISRKTRRLQSSSDQLNDDIVVNNEISILADPYANENFYSIRYVEFNDVKWKVTSVEVRYPRLILSLGGIYNE